VTSLEGFIVSVREAVEAEARAHADDRWWVLAPTLLVQRDGGEVGFLEIGPRLAGRPVGRALMAGDARLILETLGVRRCAIALHVDLERDDELLAAIVVMVLTPMTSSLQYAPLERTDAGTPRLAGWEVGGLAEDELFAAIGRALTREPPQHFT
jgi:hypothetical protein